MGKAFRRFINGAKDSVFFIRLPVEAEKGEGG
jgi:hypothetical protein